MKMITNQNPRERAGRKDVLGYSDDFCVSSEEDVHTIDVAWSNNSSDLFRHTRSDSNTNIEPDRKTYADAVQE